MLIALSTISRDQEDIRASLCTQREETGTISCASGALPLARHQVQRGRTGSGRPSDARPPVCPYRRSVGRVGQRPGLTLQMLSSSIASISRIGNFEYATSLHSQNV